MMDMEMESMQSSSNVHSEDYQDPENRPQARMDQNKDGKDKLTSTADEEAQVGPSERVTLLQPADELTTEKQELPLDITFPVLERQMCISIRAQFLKPEEIPDTIEDEYRQTLKGLNVPASLREELHLHAVYNNTNKLRIICEILSEQNIPLHADEMLGEEFGETALHAAVVKENVEAVKILVEFGGPELISKPYGDLSDCEGMTALHLAIDKQSYDVVNLILDATPESERIKLLNYCPHKYGSYLMNKYSCTQLPLSLALAVGYLPIIELLIQRGADLWSRCPVTGNTALHTLADISKHSDNSSKKAVFVFQILLQSPVIKSWWLATRDKLTRMTDERSSKNYIHANLTSGCLCLGGQLKRRKTAFLTESKETKDQKQGVVPQWHEFTPEEALLKIENYDRFTPFTYACCIGALDLVGAMLEVNGVYTFPQFQLGPSSYHLYEVSEIDTMAKGKMKNIQCDHEITEGFCLMDKEHHKTKAIEMYAFIQGNDWQKYSEIPAIKEAILNKWEALKWLFYGWFFLHTAVMILFTASLPYLNIPRNKTTTAQNNSSMEYPVRGNKSVFAMVIIVFLFALFYFVQEIVDSVSLLKRYRKRFKGFQTNRWIPFYLRLQFDLFRLILFLFSLSYLIAFILHVTGSQRQDVAFALASFFGWFFLLFFTRSSKQIGIFTVMLQRMVVRELAYFTAVFIVVMLACGSAIFLLYNDPYPEEVNSLQKTFYSLFRLLLGLEEFAIISESGVPAFMIILFIFFVLIANILLLNMLIAAMSNTFNELNEKKVLMWLKLRTKAVLMIERRLPSCFRPEHKMKRYGKVDQWFLGVEGTAQTENPYKRKNISMVY